MSTLQVVSPDRWPSGDDKPIAVLDFTPDELSYHYHISFKWDSDDFDEYQFVAIKDETLGQIWLFRYEHSPDPGTEVLVDSDISVDTAIKAVMSLLNIDKTHFTWEAP